MIRRAGLTLALLAVSLCACDGAPSQIEVELPNRVVTLAPHLAELMYAVGAGDLLVGVSSWSDYPPEVNRLPVVGDAFALDHERLALLEPELLLAWESGMPGHVVDELRQAGYRVVTVRTRGADDVADAMLQIGALLSRTESAQAAARDYRDRLAAIRNEHRDASPIRVFYQASVRPLYTVNSDHFLSDLIAACGGQNIFDDLGDLAPAIADEAVIARDPEVMVAGDNSAADPFADWHRWPDISANRYGNHFTIDWNLASRPAPRLLLAAEEICAALDQARVNRGKMPRPR